MSDWQTFCICLTVAIMTIAICSTITEVMKK